jgi:hypothetical protein
MTGLTDEQYEQAMRKQEGWRIVKVEELTGQGVTLKLMYHQNKHIIALCTWQHRSKMGREKVLEQVLAPLGLMEHQGKIVPFLTKLERGRA